MTAKEFLEKVREQKKTESRIKMQLKEEWARAVSLASPALGDKVQSNQQKDISDLLVRIEEREVKLAEELGKLFDMEKVAEELIAIEEDETARNVLTYRYIEGKKWEWIACQMKYMDTRWIQRKANIAIEHIERSPLKKKLVP